MRYPTRVVGNGALVRKLVASTAFCRLVGVVGYNDGVDIFIQIHELAAEPGEETVPMFAFPADQDRSFSFALPNPVDLSACTVVASSTLDTYTPVGGTDVTIQCLFAS